MPVVDAGTHQTLSGRPLLRAAAVGGGAYAFGKHKQRQQEEAEQQAYYEGREPARQKASILGI